MADNGKRSNTHTHSDKKSSKRTRTSSPANNNAVINVFGDIFTDIVARVPSKLNLAGGDTLSKIDIFPGGSGLNLSVHLSSYLRNHDDSRANSLKCRMFSCVGDDTHGRMCHNYLTQCGVDASHVKICTQGARTGTCIVLSSGTERSFITDGGCVCDELALKLFTANDKKALFSEDMVHFHMSGIYNIKQLRKIDRNGAEIIRIFEQIKKVNRRNGGVCTSLNPQYDAIGEWDCIRPICHMLDVLIANEEEIMQIANSNEGREQTNKIKRISGNAASTQAEAPAPALLSKAASLSEAAIRVLSWGANVVVATLGSRGAVAFLRSDNTTRLSGTSSPISPRIRRRSPMLTVYDEENNTHWKISELECVADRLDSSIIDTTGAGDAFAAAFVGELTSARQKHIASAMRAGCEAGGRSCTVVGGSTLVF
eukprot:GSChrysophyteH1.ASY1.ANO1.654.1 assembled CDS